MAHPWQEIHKDETSYVERAFDLLRATMDGYDHLPVTIPNDKMQQGTNPPTPYHCLRLYSYGNP